MSSVANIHIDTGIDVAELSSQLRWLVANGIAVPSWLAVLVSETDQKNAVFGRPGAVDVAEFMAFRKLLHGKWGDAICVKPRAEIPYELEGLLSLFDYLYDKIDELMRRHSRSHAQGVVDAAV